jgi:hypothetical protein
MYPPSHQRNPLNPPNPPNRSPSLQTRKDTTSANNSRHPSPLTVSQVNQSINTSANQGVGYISTSHSSIPICTHQPQSKTDKALPRKRVESLSTYHWNNIRTRFQLRWTDADRHLHTSSAPRRFSREQRIVDGIIIRVESKGSVEDSAEDGVT